MVTERMTVFWCATFDVEWSEGESALGERFQSEFSPKGFPDGPRCSSVIVLKQLPFSLALRKFSLGDK